MDLRLKPRYKLFDLPEITMSGQKRRAHILNLSVGGALFHFDQPPVPHEVLQISCGAQTRSARVVWVNGRRVGVSFIYPLLNEEVMQILDAE